MRASPAPLCYLLLSAAAAVAQGPIEPKYDDWVAPDEPIALACVSEATRFAVFIGDTDVTDLFRRTDDGLTYRPELLELPAGETEIVVYAVDDRWREVGRFPLRVERPHGVRSFRVQPRLDLESSALLDDDTGEGETGFSLVTGQLDLGIDVERTGISVAAQLNVVGVTELEQALRFGELGPAAPRADLSSYRLAFSHGETGLELGHVAFGDSRHLLSSFGGRGIALRAPLGRRLDVGVTVVNGTSIVGWSNILGVDRSAHRLLAGTLGMDLVPEGAGAMRLEATALDASILPLAGFNQALVSDAERSDGWSLRMSGSTPGERLRYDGAFSESTFTNPEDPLLSQGGSLVAVEEETRSARYLDLGLRLIDGAQLGAAHRADLELSVRHERVEPLYRSVGAYAQADIERNEVDLTASLGPVSATLSASRSEDNLDQVLSILTTRTDRRALNLSLPLADLLTADESRPSWAPYASYVVDWTHQRGLGVPPDSGFDESHVPDQVSLSQNLGLSWSWSSWRLQYALGLSDQDNRQVGRETADFEAMTHAVTLGFAALDRFDLTLDWGLEEATNVERGEVETTDRYGVSLSYRPVLWLSLSGSAWRTEGESSPQLRDSQSTTVDLQANLRLDRLFGERHGFGAQLFVRYAYQRSLFRDFVFGFAEDTSSWSLTSGINLSLF